MFNREVLRVRDVGRWRRWVGQDLLGCDFTCRMYTCREWDSCASARVCLRPPLTTRSMAAVLRILCFFVCFCGAAGRVGHEAPGAFFAQVRGGNIANYAEVRARVEHGFVEKANEIADTLAVLQDLSKATSGLIDLVSQHCAK